MTTDLYECHRVAGSILKYAQNSLFYFIHHCRRDKTGDKNREIDNVGLS